MSRGRRFSGIASVLAVLFLGFHCEAIDRARPRTMFGEGLESGGSDGVKVYLNAGVLTHKSEKLYPREDVQRLLDGAAAKLEQKYEGLSFHFILDQSQDLEFVTGRALRKTNLKISPFALREGLERANAYLREIAVAPFVDIARSALLRNTGSLSISLPQNAQNGATDYVFRDAENLLEGWLGADWSQKWPELAVYNFLSYWQSYSSEQIHYDVILTDARILPDSAWNISHGAGKSDYYLLPAPGRAALDRIALVVSLNGVAGSDSNQAALVEGLEHLILPTMEDEAIGMDWGQRRMILKVLHRFYNKGKKDACPDWNLSSYNYVEPVANLSPPLGSLLTENRYNLDRLCN